MVSALVSLTDRFIRWPASEQSKQDIARKFEEKAGFPAVLGAIDGTHIQIHPRQTLAVIRQQKKLPQPNIAGSLPAGYDMFSLLLWMAWECA